MPVRCQNAVMGGRNCNPNQPLSQRRELLPVKKAERQVDSTTRCQVRSKSNRKEVAGFYHISQTLLPFCLFSLVVLCVFSHMLARTCMQGSTTIAGVTATFQPTFQLQRAGLAISNDKVIVSYGAHCDMNTYQGVMAFNAVHKHGR